MSFRLLTLFVDKRNILKYQKLARGLLFDTRSILLASNLFDKEFIVVNNVGKVRFESKSILSFENLTVMQVNRSIWGNNLVEENAF